MADLDQKSRKVSVTNKKKSARAGKGKSKDAKYDDVSRSLANITLCGFKVINWYYVTVNKR